ncbi:hypothetical protein HJ01_02606 [Flavobacterium frigoris PS1]|uniref:Uncharacterized protein n=1 Tax=Flavobacterium frigoris (strain PS1) TaxID=1086011 RepID=H7FTT4_FLAFP|nr:hypothetical protein HJ01_02606 [Flavobacterium frigoris PS1]
MPTYNYVSNRNFYFSTNKVLPHFNIDNFTIIIFKNWYNLGYSATVLLYRFLNFTTSPNNHLSQFSKFVFLRKSYCYEHKKNVDKKIPKTATFYRKIRHNFFISKKKCGD